MNYVAVMSILFLFFPVLMEGAEVGMNVMQPFVGLSANISVVWSYLCNFLYSLT